MRRSEICVLHRVSAASSFELRPPITASHRSTQIRYAVSLISTLSSLFPALSSAILAASSLVGRPLVREAPIDPHPHQENYICLMRLI
jgi:hypothetical protein